MIFENTDDPQDNVRCQVCKEPAVHMTDFIGLNVLPNGTGGWFPACELCDKINDQMYDLKLTCAGFGCSPEDKR